MLKFKNVVKDQTMSMSKWKLTLPLHRRHVDPDSRLLHIYGNYNYGKNLAWADLEFWTCWAWGPKIYLHQGSQQTPGLQVCSNKLARNNHTYSAHLIHCGRVPFLYQANSPSSTRPLIQTKIGEPRGVNRFRV